MKIAIIGLGYWGKNYLRIIQSYKEIDLVAVIDPNFNLSLNNEVLNFKSLNEMLNAKIEIDAAIVCTPTNTHYELIKTLLLNKISVLAEKPLTTKSEQATELINLAKKNNLVLLVDHTFLYNNALNFAIDKINSGEIGSLLHINFERTNLGPIRTDVSCLWDLTTHDIAILNAITNLEPEKINASIYNSSSSTSFDMINVSLNYKDSLFVTLFSSWLHPDKVRRIKFVGDKKMIVFDDLNLNEPIKVYDKKFDQIYDKQAYSLDNNSFFSFSIGDVVSPYIEKSEPLKEVVNHFLALNSSDKNYESINDLELTFRTVQILEKIEIATQK